MGHAKGRHLSTLEAEMKTGPRLKFCSSLESVAARLKSCHLTAKMRLVEEAVRPLLPNCLGLRMHEIHMCSLTAGFLGQPDLGAAE